MSTDHVSTHPDSPLHGNGIGSEAINLAAIRQEYTKGGLKEGDLPDNPLSLFNRWLHEAIDAQVDEPTAMLVGTVSPEGQPSTRTVLLKDLHDGKFIFYTNYESRKGTHLAKNPYISLSFVWHALERQVHIEGIASKVPAGESDTYFRQRPYKSRIEVERPAHWGGYAVTPHRIEFWQGRANRLHDRFLYSLQPDGSWQKERLAP